MDWILIRDLEVAYTVGVSAAERRSPQRLLLSIELGLDFAAAAAGDDLAWTIDYAAVCQRLLNYGERRSWKLLETLAVELADMVRSEFGAREAVVEVKKFIIPQARSVGVRVIRPARRDPMGSP